MLLMITAAPRQNGPPGINTFCVFKGKVRPKQHLDLISRLFNDVRLTSGVSGTLGSVFEIQRLELYPPTASSAGLVRAPRIRV